MFEKSLGCALSGGGIKAYSQVGVLKRLHEANIKIDGYAGTSMGSIIATFAACGQSPSQIEERMLRIEKAVIEQNLLKATNSQFFPVLKQSATGLISPLPFREVIHKELLELGVETLKDIKTPLVIVSTDLITGGVVYFTNRKKAFKKRSFEVVFEDAYIIDALQASCSFPMVFETMEYQGHQLTDGGVLMNLPVRPLRQLGFNTVMSISMENLSSFKSSKKVSDVALRIMDITTQEAIRNAIAMSDFNLNVYDKSIGIFSFKKGKEAIDLGYNVADKAIHEIDSLKINLKRFFI